MTVSSRGIALTIGLFALLLSGGARAQENLDEGKTPAQLYQADCAICHKTMRGMTSAGGIGGLESFLREHYTSSRESAAAISRYISETQRGPLPAGGKHTARPRHEERRGVGEKSAEKKKSGKSGEAKVSEKKPRETKESKKKPAEVKSLESKPAEAKATEKKKPKEDKAGEKKPPEKEAMSKSAKPKAGEKRRDKATDAKASASKPSDKPEQPKDAKSAQ
jgi:hypothetical protein